jgi:hypothetical protein
MERSKSDTIVVILGGSAYNATRHFAFDLTNAFSKLGYNVELVNPNLKGLDEIFRKRKVLFILGMNGHGILQLSRDLYKNRLKVPYFAYLVDHPMYHIGRFDFNTSPKNLIISCVDQTHVDYLKKYFTGDYFKVFVPHGSALSIKEPPIKPIKSRPIDILFAGTYISPDDCRSHWISDSIYGKVIDEIVENALYQNKQPLLDIAEKTFSNKGMEFNYSKDEKLKNMLVKADYFIRGRRRKEVLENLINLPIHVFHSGWSYLESMGGNVKVFSNINYDEFQKKMFESKIVLNVLPNLVFGGHDRLFTSTLAGSVCLTDSNPYLNSWYKDKEDILMYNFKDSNLSDQVHQMLLNDVKLQEIADKGKEITKKNHTWLNRASQIIKHVKWYKASNY